MPLPCRRIVLLVVDPNVQVLEVPSACGLRCTRSRLLGVSLRPLVALVVLVVVTRALSLPLALAAPLAWVGVLPGGSAQSG